MLTFIIPLPIILTNARYGRIIKARINGIPTAYSNKQPALG
jgi:hypothetical protein